jgi:hypothetical protein
MGRVRRADVGGTRGKWGWETVPDTLSPGENPEDQNNTSILNVKQLSNSNLGVNATVTLNACHAALGGDRSIAKQIAIWLHRTVYAYPVDMYFSSDPTPRRWNKNIQAPQTVPAYMVPNGDGIQPTAFTPE